MRYFSLWPPDEVPAHTTMTLVLKSDIAIDAFINCKKAKSKKIMTRVRDSFLMISLSRMKNNLLDEGSGLCGINCGEIPSWVSAKTLMDLLLFIDQL